MTKVYNITVTNAEVLRMNLLQDSVSGEVRAELHYGLIADDGSVFREGDRTYWEVIPDPVLDELGNPIPNPATWFQLPPTYVTTIKNLFSTAVADIEGDEGI